MYATQLAAAILLMIDDPVFVQEPVFTKLRVDTGRRSYRDFTQEIVRLPEFTLPDAEFIESRPWRLRTGWLQPPRVIGKPVMLAPPTWRHMCRAPSLRQHYANKARYSRQAIRRKAGL